MASRKAGDIQPPAKASPAEAFVAFDDNTEDISARPLSGQDLWRFRSRHQLQTHDAIYALGIQNSAIYNKLSKITSPDKLPFVLEMLIRLYDRHPGHAPWGEVTAMQAFDRIYGEHQRMFRGTSHEKEARLALYRRFTALFGRSVFTAYRWLESDGKGKQAVNKIFQKLLTLENPRKVLEDIAKLMYRVRGVDLDQMCPLPSLENPPAPRRRGPLSKKEREAQAAAAFAAAAPAAQPSAKKAQKVAPVKASAKKPSAKSAKRAAEKA